MTAAAVMVLLMLIVVMRLSGDWGTFGDTASPPAPALTRFTCSKMAYEYPIVPWESTDFRFCSNRSRSKPVPNTTGAPGDWYVTFADGDGSSSSLFLKE